jgi:hypothetical protein
VAPRARSSRRCLPFGKGHAGRGTQKEGHMAIAAHAGVHILLRHVEEAEHVLRVGLADFRRLAGPGVRVRHAFLGELHEHAACGHVFFRDGRRWRDELILRLQRVDVDGAAIDGHFIEPAIQRMRGGRLSSRCRSPPRRHRSLAHDPSHRPCPRRRRWATVDEALDALGLFP